MLKKSYYPQLKAKYHLKIHHKNVLKDHGCPKTVCAEHTRLWAFPQNNGGHEKYSRASFMLILSTSPYLLLEVQVILPLPSPRQVQSTIIQP